MSPASLIDTNVRSPGRREQIEARRLFLQLSVEVLPHSQAAPLSYRSPGKLPESAPRHVTVTTAAMKKHSLITLS